MESKTYQACRAGIQDAYCLGYLPRGRGDGPAGRGRLKKLGSAPAPGAAADALVRRREQQSASMETVSFCISPHRGSLLHSEFSVPHSLDAPP
jgi:hypothetical protein